MDLRDLGTLLSGVAAICGVVSALVSLKVKADMGEVRTYIEKARREDTEAIKNWVELHFARRGRA